MTRRLNVLEIYPFGNGLGQAFEPQHNLVRVDFARHGREPDFMVTPRELLTWSPPSHVDSWTGGWDVVLCRPFCPTYSRGAFYMHYRSHVTGEPLTDRAREADAIVQAQLRIAQEAQPRLGWLLENPNGDLRKCAWMKPYPVTTVTLCQYGDVVRKATDLFGPMPPSFVPRACKTGSDCHMHSNWKAKTGSVYGDALKKTKGSPFNKAALPFSLSLSICQAFERLDRPAELATPIALAARASAAPLEMEETRE